MIRGGPRVIRVLFPSCFSRVLSRPSPKEVYILSDEYSMMDMIHPDREKGLSEIVGFVLILAAIVIAFALYSSFGIPAQGREGEIAHMNEVRDRFVEYKVNLDSLWSNRQCGTAIGTSFTLGTGGGATTGSFSIIPILAPVKTSATLALNQRPEYITIIGDSYLMTNNPAQSWNETDSIGTSATNIAFSTNPAYFFITLNTSDIQQSGGVHLTPASGSGWEAWVNITPVYYYADIFNLTVDPFGRVVTYGNWSGYKWNRTDITVSSRNESIQLLQDFIVYRNITSAPTTYVVDLMNPAYGINTNLGSAQTIVAQKSSPAIGSMYVTNYSYWPGLITLEQLMGSLEYRAQNEYWIPQTYFYQMGGVFLEQNEGNTVKIPPSLTLTNDTNGIPVVQINQILLTGSGAIEGSGPVQVTSSVTRITDTQLAAGNNTRFVNISVRTQSQNAAQMWLQVFNSTAEKASFPTSLYKSGTAGNESYINITSTNPSMYGVRLSLNKVEVNAAIQTATPG
jgi:hypothetical protein